MASLLLSQLGTSPITLLLVLILLCRFVIPARSDAQCYNNGNFSAKSSYAVNRRLLLSSIRANITASGGFFSGSLGTTPNNTVYALTYCRGDSPPQSWAESVNTTAAELTQSCPNQKQVAAIRFDSHCNVHYSDVPIHGVLDMSTNLVLYNTGDITMDLDEFDRIWRSHLESLAVEASSKSGRLKFATGEAILPDSNTIYALLQCSSDLSASDCRKCLVHSMDEYRSCCREKAGGVVPQPSSFLRWDLYYFYAYSPAPPPPPPPPPPTPPLPTPPPPPATLGSQAPPPRPGPLTFNNEDWDKASLAAVIAVPAICFLIIVVTAVLFRTSWKLPSILNVFPSSTEDWSRGHSLLFKLKEIRLATNEFSDTNKLGQGGFGNVYKGRLVDGQEVAVKRLEQSSDHEGKRQFKNEMTLMARLEHKNLVKLVGFCFEQGERILIYEFVPYASLDRFISDPNKRVLLDWRKRYRIVKGLARGLLYLHVDSQLRIIHRDLKPGNVLLDEEMNPKIADFGTARLFDADQSKERTRRIAGT